MAMATVERTATAAETHPAPPPVVEGERDDEPVESRRPWSIADEVLTGVRQMQDFARVIAACRKRHSHKRWFSDCGRRVGHR
jgi:hypothetical protein